MLRTLLLLLAISTQSFAQSPSATPPITKLLCKMQRDGKSIDTPREYLVSESDGWKVSDTSFSRRWNESGIYLYIEVSRLDGTVREVIDDRNEPGVYIEWSGLCEKADVPARKF